MYDFVHDKSKTHEISKILKDLFPGGYFTPEDVVNAARPKASPLHEYFEWNDSRAAELYRINQARKIIQCVVVRIEGSDVREFQNVFVKEENRRMYVHTNEARKSEALWEQVLAQALEEIYAWKRRYQNLKQLSSIMTEITKIEGKYAKNKDSKTRRASNQHPQGRVQARKDNPRGRVTTLSKSLR